MNPLHESLLENFTSGVTAESSVKDIVNMHTRVTVSLDAEDDQLIKKGPINYAISNVLIAHFNRSKIAELTNQLMLVVTEFWIHIRLKLSESPHLLL